MSQYKLIDIIKYKPEYEDPNKKIKNILTDFINKNFLTYNNNIIVLLKLIYNTITPILHKYDLFLVFKGGNVMRMINNNLKEYLMPIENEIITETFDKFLKQSDNDFTVYIYPNRPQYDMFINKICNELYKGLNSIKYDITKNPEKYFELFNKSIKYIYKKFNDLSLELDSNNVKLSPTYNKIVQLENPNNRRSDVLVFEDRNSSYKYLFNSANTSISFLNYKNDLIKFYLLRSKINFKIDNEYDIAGELIDISIPHRKDFEMSKLGNKNTFDKYIRNNVVYDYDEEYGFGYYTVTIEYLVDDLYKILYLQNEKPWQDSKYQKRLARLVYFIFIKQLNNNTISIASHMEIKENFRVFMKQLLYMKPYLENKNEDLQRLFISTLKIDDNSDNFKFYVSEEIKYTKAIIDILDSMIEYSRGLNRIDESNLYNLDIV